jgi:hypothetical protein
MNDGRFKPGNSGRPKGSRHKTTLAVEALLEGEAEALTRRAIDAALNGDGTALRLCMERIAPARRGNTVRIDLGGPVRTLVDLQRATGALLEALAAGEVSTDEAADIAALFDKVGAAIERRDLEGRVAALETMRLA